MASGVHLALVCAIAGCGNDRAGTDSIPTYLQDIAPILQDRCVSCHSAPTVVAQVENCVRLDRWDSSPDPQRLCTDAAMTGLIFGVHDASAMLVDQVLQGQMPFGGPTLDAQDIATLSRWCDAGFPRRSPNAPPAIQFTAPTSAITLCNPGCTYPAVRRRRVLHRQPDAEGRTRAVGGAGPAVPGLDRQRRAEQLNRAARRSHQVRRRTPGT
jgi:hypothetical protein